MKRSAAVIAGVFSLIAFARSNTLSATGHPGSDSPALPVLPGTLTSRGGGSFHDPDRSRTGVRTISQLPPKLTDSDGEITRPVAWQ